MTSRYCKGDVEGEAILPRNEHPTTSHFTVEVFEQIDGLDLGGDLNLVLPTQFNETSVDQVQTYMGSRDPGEDDYVLTETDENSLIFNGDASWADATVELTNFAGLTSSVDTINATWTFLFRNGVVEAYQLQMVETEAESNRFVYDLGVKNGYEVTFRETGSSNPCTFMPSLIRIEAPPDSSLTGKAEISAFGRYWDVKAKDFGDGEYWYAADGQENATVFLPATYAESHIQTMKAEGPFKTVLMDKKGREVGEVEIPTEHGLVVADSDVENTLKIRLKGFEKTEHPQLGHTFYIFKSSGTGFDVQDNELKNEPRTEIFWRYVGTKNTIVYFNSFAEFTNDYSYREFVIEKAKGLKFPFATGVDIKYNTKYWPNQDQTWPTDSDFAAMADVVADGSKDKYALGCARTTAYICLYGASMVLGQETFDDMIANNPWYYRMHVLQTEPVPDDGTARWIPGDAVYIENDIGVDESGQKKKPPEGQEGENLIYLGGCFEKSMANFMGQADFWGQIPVKDPDRDKKVRTLNEWIPFVEGFDKTRNDNAKLHYDRTYLKQPPKKEE